MSSPTLIVCYFNTGTSRRVADLLATQFQWQRGEICERRSRAGVAGMLRCVGDSLLRRHPAIRYEGPDPRGFETVVLIAPTDPQAWKDAAPVVQGSWWPVWHAWLRAHSCARVPAVPVTWPVDDLGTVEAPGTYVHQR